MTFENIILGSIILYLLYQIYSAIKKPSNVKVLCGNGQVVEINLNEIANHNPEMLDFKVFAKMAFTRISHAFALGKLKEIKDEVSPHVFKAFEQAIQVRESNKQHMDFTLIGFVDVKVSKGADMASMNVEFTTEQINLLKDEKQKVIEGDPMHVATVKEQWTFVKEADNWVLSAVRSGEGYLA